MLEVQAKTSRHTYHDLENRKEEEVMTLTEKQKQIARKLVTSFGAVSDCEMSSADIHWLTRNIEHALREALELAEKSNIEALRSHEAMKALEEWTHKGLKCLITEQGFGQTGIYFELTKTDSTDGRGSETVKQIMNAPDLISAIEAAKKGTE